MEQLKKTVINNKTNRYGEIFSNGDGNFFFIVYTLDEYFITKSGLIGSYKQCLSGLYSVLDQELNKYQLEDLEQRKHLGVKTEYMNF